MSWFLWPMRRELCCPQAWDGHSSPARPHCPQLASCGGTHLRWGRPNGAAPGSTPPRVCERDLEPHGQSSTARALRPRGHLLPCDAGTSLTLQASLSPVGRPCTYLTGLRSKRDAPCVFIAVTWGLKHRMPRQSLGNSAGPQVTWPAQHLTPGHLRAQSHWAATATVSASLTSARSHTAESSGKPPLGGLGPLLLTHQACPSPPVFPEAQGSCPSLHSQEVCPLQCDGLSPLLQKPSKPGLGTGSEQLQGAGCVALRQGGRDVTVAVTSDSCPAGPLCSGHGRLPAPRTWARPPQGQGWLASWGGVAGRPVSLHTGSRSAGQCVQLPPGRPGTLTRWLCRPRRDSSAHSGWGGPGLSRGGDAGGWMPRTGVRRHIYHLRAVSHILPPSSRSPQRRPTL